MSHRITALGVAAMLLVPAGAAALPTGGQVTIVRSDSGFDERASLRTDGRGARITGPIRCTKGGRLRIDVTLTQRKTGALARGTWRGTCTGAKQTWTLKSARVVGEARLQAGAAQACAAAVARNSKRATDALQWCEPLTLVAG